MSDEALRELERRWRASGAVEDEAAWLVACLRAGATGAATVRLRALLGDPAARLAVGRRRRVGDGLSRSRQLRACCKGPTDWPQCRPWRDP